MMVPKDLQLQEIQKQICADSLPDVVWVSIKRLFEENSSSGLFPQIMSFWFDSAMCLNVVAMCLDCQEWKGDTVHEL